MTSPVDNASIAENLAAVRERIARAAGKAGRQAGDITMIAVSKGKPAGVVTAAYLAGHRIFGENRVQEAVAKLDELGDSAAGAEWHLIGHLQSNKARMVPGRFGFVHTVDSVRLAQALEKHTGKIGAALQVCIQLNWSREPTKSGVTGYGELAVLVETLAECPSLATAGLMTMPDPNYTEMETRRHFSDIRELLHKVRGEFGLGDVFRELSMGMSHDYEWAIEEGATMVRVGTAIFGARK